MGAVSPRRREPAAWRNRLDYRIVALLADGRPRGAEEIAGLLGVEAAAVRESLTRLLIRRRVVRVGEHGGADWTVPEPE